MNTDEHTSISKIREMENNTLKLLDFPKSLKHKNVITYY